MIVTQHFYPENFRINDIVDGMIHDGIDVDVLCGLPNYPKGDWFDGYRYIGPRYEVHNGVRIFRSGEIPRKGNKSLTIFLNYISWPLFALFHLPRLPGKYDAILCYNTSPVLMSFPAIVYGKLHRIPVTNYVLDIWPENLYSVLNVKNQILRNIAMAVSNWHYTHVEKLIAMSSGLKTRLLERTGKAEEKVAIIPQYCEDFYATPLKDDALQNKWNNAFNLVFAGNFSPAQSLDTVILGVVKAKSYPECSSLQLLLVGDGMSRQSLEDLVKELNAESFIHFCGSVPPTDIPRYAYLADGLIVSLNDSPDLGLTVPAKVASCMAAGKPILGSLNGEGADALRAAKCGFVSPASDPDAFASSIASLCRCSYEDRMEMGRHAYGFYCKHYRRAELLAQLENFLLNK